MIDIEKLKSLNEYFKEKTLDEGEVLFDEGEIDNNLYYILSGNLSIEKYTTKERKNTKQLAVIGEKDFFGEGALSNNDSKQVKILALQKTVLLYIDAKTKFLEFMKKYPKIAKDILVYIISITNKRTLIGNKYIASIYEINKSIRNIKKINFKEIFKILDKINLILEGKYLLFLETSPIDINYLTLKYDTKNIGKMQDVLLEKGKYSLEEIGIKDNEEILIKEVVVGKEVLGSIILVKDEDFTQNDKRIFLAMVNSLVGILMQKKFLEEERDRIFSRG